MTDEPNYRRPRINLRPEDGPPPARRATDRYITVGALDIALAMWGFVAFLVALALLAPWERALLILLWVFAGLFLIKAAVMTYVAGGLVRIWMHYRGRRRR